MPTVWGRACGACFTAPTATEAIALVVPRSVPPTAATSRTVCALGLLVPAFLLPIALHAETSVYRCSDDSGVVTFSDRPCGDEAERYRLPTTLSVIAGADDVAERAALNRAFIERRRERAQTRSEPRPALPEQRQQAESPSARPDTVYVPYWLARPAAGETRERPSPAQRQRGEERFSALGGRQPGSVRREDR